MKTTQTHLKHSGLPKTYNGLAGILMPRPIHDKVSYENAVEMAHALAGFKLTQEQDEYQEIMAKLIEDYEKEILAEPKPVTAIKTLEYLLHENDLTGDDLGKILGVNRSIAYRILKGSRNLTAEHVKKLSARFAVSADLFLR